MNFQFSDSLQVSRRRFLAGAGATALLAASGAVRAQGAYPSHAVTITVPYAPGGQGDVFARLLSERLGATLKQTFVVENRPGATGAVGTSMVTRAAADGYHLLLGQTGEIVVNPFVMSKLNYDPQRDLVPVVLVGDSPLVMAVPAKSAHADLKSLLETARSKPGAVTYASSGTATPGHLAGLALSRATKTDMTHVPYKGAGQAMTDLLGGHVDFFFSSASAAMPHVSSGNLRVLAVSTAQRIPALANVPTIAETVVPGFQFSLWGGFFAPANTPKEVIELLNREINTVLADPAMLKRFEADGTLVRQNTPAEFADFVRTETDKYRELVKATGVKAEG
jgi:tripartite-type tricarboxylate transporter receptor subunit TctC